MFLSGVSCRTQEIYLIVFVARYLDLFWLYVSLYNTIMKIFFIISTGWLIYTMRIKPPVSTTYDRNADNFQYEKWLLPPCALLALITTAEYSISEILWTMSIWLESVAIFPQLVLLQQLREVENLTSNFVFAMGAYRFFYILNWIYRYFVEGYVNWVGWIGGVIQTGLYVDFFYYYAMSKWYGQRLILPTVA
jgi:ER lumen protein retaining receptor